MYCFINFCIQLSLKCWLWTEMCTRLTSVSTRHKIYSISLAHLLLKHHKLCEVLVKWDLTQMRLILENLFIIVQIHSIFFKIHECEYRDSRDVAIVCGGKGSLYLKCIAEHMLQLLGPCNCPKLVCFKNTEKAHKHKEISWGQIQTVQWSEEALPQVSSPESPSLAEMHYWHITLQF